jgi:hypothetical protein
MQYVIETIDGGNEVVEGEKIGKYFGVRPSAYSDPNARYTIDHLPTGSHVTLVRTLENARKVIRYIQALNIPWESANFNEIKAAINEQGFEYVMIDLAYDGLIYGSEPWLSNQILVMKSKGLKHTCYLGKHGSTAF